jgi:hypothetical protein
VVILLLACAPRLDEVDRAWINRASLDVRGVRPTADEWALAAQDPDALVDTFVADARFERRARDLWAEIYRTQVDESEILGADLGVPDETAFKDSVGQEPLRLLGYVASHDLPWTTLLTADYTFADENLGTAFPIDRPAGDGWIKSHYTDDRPAAGVLATNGFWRRYTSTASNANRGRANAVSRILLCHDYLDQPIGFDPEIDLADAAAVTSAVREDPACVACHVSLDPIASSLFGFWWFSFKDPVESVRYYPEREALWASFTGVPPSWFGVPTPTLTDLAQAIAADPRFPNCAVEQAWSLLLRRDVRLDDTDAIVHHRDVFLDGGLRLRPLVRSILDDPRYRAPDPDADGDVPLKMVTAPLLASMVEDLTGYRWTDDAGHELLAMDAGGYRTLAGGIDGVDVPTPLRGPNATVPLVQERIAEAASRYVVDTDPTRLFTVDVDANPDADTVRTEVDALWLRVLGRAPSAGDRDATVQLWLDLDRAEGPRSAWAGVLCALLRDPTFLLY